MLHSRVFRNLPAAFSLVLLAACGGKPQANSTPGPRRISGQARYVVRDATGVETPSWMDLHGAFFAAEFPTETGWDVHSGQAHTDGVFEIDDVPDGSYWLRIYDSSTRTNQYIWTDADQLDFQVDGVGRNNVVVASTNPTNLTFKGLSGMADWANDGLELVVANLGLYVPIPLWPENGTSTLDGTMNWVGYPLISANAHDQAILTQIRLEQDQASGIVYGTPIRSAVLDPYSQADGVETEVTGTFTTPPELPYHWNWKRSAFTPYKTSIHATLAGDAQSQYFEVGAMPGGVAHGVLQPLLPTVMWPDQSALREFTDLNVTLTLRNPYPGDWLVTRMNIAFPVSLPVPGAPKLTPVQTWGAIGHWTNEVPTESSPIKPMLTPARSPQINGKDLFHDQTGVGTEPTISWTAPEVGTPSAYVATVFEWQSIDSGFPGLVEAATLIVPGDVTSVKLPAQLLKPGHWYQMQFRAISQPDHDVRKHSMYTQKLPFAFADLQTSSFQP